MASSGKITQFSESVIREMTRLSDRYGAINLSQGMPDFDPPVELVNAAINALRSGYNQYPITWGQKNLRDAIARKLTMRQKCYRNLRRNRGQEPGR
jgi:aspartate/methionine/tyrosine aminotransferase